MALWSVLESFWCRPLSPTLSSSQNFACRLKQNFLFNFNVRLVSFDRLILRLIIEFPCWIRFWQRWGQRKDVEESLAKSTWMLQLKPLVGTFGQLWQLKCSTLLWFAGKFKIWKAIGVFDVVGGWWCLCWWKKAWWITRLGKVSGCLRTLQSLHKKAWGTYQNGTGTPARVDIWSGTSGRAKFYIIHIIHNKLTTDVEKEYMWMHVSNLL